MANRGSFGKFYTAIDSQKAVRIYDGKARPLALFYGDSRGLKWNSWGISKAHKGYLLVNFGPNTVDKLATFRTIEFITSQHI